MRGILPDIVRLQQPTDNCGFNPSIGKVLFAVPGSDILMQDRVSHIYPVKAQSNPWGTAINQNGRQAEFGYSSGAAYIGAVFPTDTPCIVTWTERFATPAGSYVGAISIGHTDASIPTVFFRAQSDSAYSFSIGNSATNSSVFATIGAPVVGETVTYSVFFTKGLAFCNSADGIIVYRNGVRHIASANSYFGSSPWTDRTVLGSINGYSYYGLLGNFSIVQSTSEATAKALSLNPHLIWAPIQRNIYAALSGGPTNIFGLSSASISSTAQVSSNIGYTSAGTGSIAGTPAGIGRTGSVNAALVAMQASPNAQNLLGDAHAGVVGVSTSTAAMGIVGTLRTIQAQVLASSGAAQVRGYLSTTQANFKSTALDITYVLGMLANAVDLGVASCSFLGRAIQYSTPIGTFLVIPREFLRDYDVVHLSGNFGVLRNGGICIVL